MSIGSNGRVIAKSAKMFEVTDTQSMGRDVRISQAHSMHDLRRPFPCGSHESPTSRAVIWLGVSISILTEFPPRSCAPARASTEIGVGLTSFGSLFLFLGILLFFDRGLLAMGNVCRPLSEEIGRLFNDSQTCPHDQSA